MSLKSIIWRYINYLGIAIAILLFVWSLFGGKYTIKNDRWETLYSDELNYQIVYPAYWTAETFRAGFKNLHRGLPEGIRAFFYRPTFSPSPSRKTVALFWLSKTDLEDAQKWGQDTIEKGKKKEKLFSSHNEQVGVGQYPALVRIYQPDKVSITKIVYIPTDDGTFVIEFLATGYTEEIEAIFDYMLASFEILS